MKAKTLGSVLLIAGLIVSVYGLAPSVFALSGVPEACPTTVSFTFADGLTVTGNLLSPIQATAAWSVSTNAYNGLQATYSSSATYAAINADTSGYTSAPIGNYYPGYFQSLSGGPTYLYLQGLNYQGDGSCSANPVSTTSAVTFTSTSGTATFTCAGVTCTVTATDTNIYAQSSTTQACNGRCAPPAGTPPNYSVVLGGLALGIVGLIVRRKG